MKIFIIDGNNLIGKNAQLFKIQKKDKQTAREKLSLILDSYFNRSKNKAYLHFDGYQNLPIGTSSLKIFYSDNKTADDKIKTQISSSKNPRLITVVTSDNNLREFAKVCGSDVISSKEFWDVVTKKDIDEEKNKENSISNEELKRLFGVK